MLGQSAGRNCSRAVVSTQVGLLTHFMLGIEAERQAGRQSTTRPCLLAQSTPGLPLHLPLCPPHTQDHSPSTLRSRVKRNHASPSCPVWKPRPASAVNYEARPGAGLPKPSFWNQLGNPLGGTSRHSRAVLCSGALLLRATWNLHAFTGFAAALGRGGVTQG